jgi:hypothetical protein
MFFQHALKTLYHCNKAIDQLQRSRLETKSFCLFQHFPHADVVLICIKNRLIDRCFANSPYRVIYDALQRFFIFWIDRDP